MAREPSEEPSEPGGATENDDPVEDPESSPAIPSAVVASHAAGSVAYGAGASPAHGRTEREIWRLAWPVILAQVLASIVSLIDIAMVGRLGRDSVAAVGYTTQFLNLAQSVMFAVGAACVAMMARAIGARAPDRARQALGASLWISAGLASVFTAIVLAFPHELLDLLGAEPAVRDTAIAYFRLSLGSTLLLAIAITLESAFRAVRDTRTPMLIALVVTLAKTGLNYLLIFGNLGAPRLELVGAGLATFLAQGVALGGFIFAASRSGPVMRVALADLRASLRLLPEVTRIALPAVGERVVLNVAIMTYFAVLGHFGSVAIAAYTIGTRLLSFSWIPGTGFSVAAATLVGQSLGGGDPEGATRSGWRAARLALGVSIVLGISFALLREPIARVFTNDRGVVEALGPFMLMLALAQPPMGVHFTLGGALRGAGDTWTPLVAAFLGNWAFRVPLSWIFAQGFDLDVTWVWAALIADHFVRAVWLTISFRRGRWRRKVGASAR
ncbi:putative FMN/FAD exporter YeeO [Myxococcaceae bacterium]|nr:putative FMN/FAD exporter YeeO [Myxococcaceae bacterium]